MKKRRAMASMLEQLQNLPYSVRMVIDFSAIAGVLVMVTSCAVSLASVDESAYLVDNPDLKPGEH